MVKSEDVVKPEEKASLRIKLGGKGVSAVGKEGSGATKFKIKLPAAKRDVEESVKGEESEKPAKKEKRTRKRKASSPDEVLSATMFFNRILAHDLLICTCSSKFAREHLSHFMLIDLFLSGHCAQYIPVGAEIEGIGADDIEELSENDDDYYKLGAEDDEFKDYASLKLKSDHANRYILLEWMWPAPVEKDDLCSVPL